MKSEQSIPCPICQADSQFLVEGWDNSYGYPEPTKIYRCKNCGHMFAAGILSPEQLTDLYTNYYPRSQFDVENYKPYGEKKGILYWLDGEEGFAFRHVPPNSRVLDIGCGFCETLGYHKARGCEVYGVEADENARKIAQRYGFNVQIGLFDPNVYEPNYFDCVTMDHVLEHVNDPLATLNEVNKILKPGGRLIISVPNLRAWGRYFFGQHWNGWHFPYHRHFYSKKSIAFLAEQSGFVLETMRSATNSSALLNNWVHLFYGGKKRKKASSLFMTLGRFDSQTSKRFDVRFYLMLKKMRLFSLPMRIADYCGGGDWNLIVLMKKNGSLAASMGQK